jgi:formylglycine-generating enzyme required for sulfatase activity
MMGDTFELENTDALPLHAVDLSDFQITRYETTFHQYDLFAHQTGRRLPEAENGARGNHAVTDVDWDDAIAYCDWIGARLPSEGEWEFAAAGGAEKQRYAGTDSAEVAGDYGRYRVNATANSGIVGRKLPNRFGLFDMSGNVAEWIGDYYQSYPSPGEEPSRYDLKTFNIRILRGGSYTMELELTRTEWRAGTLRDIRSPAIGFRCAR